MRPKPLENTIYPHIALIVYSTSFSLFKPLAKFNESKVFYNGKNRMYACKKEVAIMASPPYYAWLPWI